MGFKRFDYQRWIELSFIEDCKILKKAKSLKEYYNKANTGLYEFLNPSLSYPYETIDMVGGQKIWKVEKQNNDPILVVTLKKGGLNNNHYWIIDFYFPETEKGFDKKQGLEGKNYLDTISKIFIDELLPYIEQSEYNTLLFKAYINDGAGNQRKTVFKKMVDKFLPKDKFTFSEEHNNFIIRKKQ